MTPIRTKKTEERLGTRIRAANPFKVELPQYDVLVCLGLLDYVPWKKKIPMMKRWESYGKNKYSKMMIGQVEDSKEMQRIHVTMNWPLYTWSASNSPYTVYKMNDTYYMMLRNISVDDIQRSLVGGTLKYNFVKSKL